MTGSVELYSQSIPVSTAPAALLPHVAEAEAMGEAALEAAIAASLALDTHAGPDVTDGASPPPPVDETDATSPRAIEISVAEAAEHTHAQTLTREQSPDYIDIAI